MDEGKQSWEKVVKIEAELKAVPMETNEEMDFKTGRSKKKNLLVEKKQRESFSESMDDNFRDALLTEEVMPVDAKMRHMGQKLQSLQDKHRERARQTEKIKGRGNAMCQTIRDAKNMARDAQEKVRSNAQRVATGWVHSYRSQQVWEVEETDQDRAARNRTEQNERSTDRFFWRKEGMAWH